MLPFEALYQSALNGITADTFGFTRFAIDLGPFGGAQNFGALLWPYALVYIARSWRGGAVGVPPPRLVSARAWVEPRA